MEKRAATEATAAGSVVEKMPTMSWSAAAGGAVAEVLLFAIFEETTGSAPASTAIAWGGEVGKACEGWEATSRPVYARELAVDFKGSMIPDMPKKLPCLAVGILLLRHVMGARLAPPEAN